MSLLPRSLHPPSSSPNDRATAKPLPSLPAFEAVENIPRKPRQKPPLPVQKPDSHDRGAGSIIRRMSHMFRPNRKSPPQSLKLNAVASVVEDCAESGEADESEDDIRRPSGLGSAVSLESPASPSATDGDKLNLSEGIYTRTRAISSPNLLRSLSLKAKNKLRAGARRGSETQAQPVAQCQASTSPAKKRSLRAPAPVQFPVEVLDLVFSHLTRRATASLCHLSRSFCSAARTNLYHTLDFDTLSPLQLQKLLALLASRRDLTDLVQECICYVWPAFMSQPPPATVGDPPSYPDGNTAQMGDELKDRLLAATFTLALQRMSNLVKLTLPHFDQSLLAYHTAFGLRSLTFMSSKLPGEDMSALFAWLDGQINVIELKFPNLEDNLPNGKASTEDSERHQQPDGAAAPIHRHQPRHSVYLKPPVPSSSIGGSASPRWAASPFPPSDSRTPSPNPAVRQSLLGSPTLLPLLSTLQATPAILALLQPPTAGSSSLELGPACSTSSFYSQTRPLRKVFLNISTTLYTGLRPNTVMASLRGSVTHLGVSFCENVDKRTVEKVLGVIGAILGSAPQEEGEEAGGEEGGGCWRGLQSLEISFRTTSVLVPGMEETLYKTLQATLSRYTRLRELYLGFLGSQQAPSPSPLTVSKGDQIFKFPVPPPGPCPSSGRSRKGSYPLQAIASALYPSVNAIRGIARKASGGGLVSRDGEEVKARVDLWSKQCPSLRTVCLSGVTWECAPASVPVVAPKPIVSSNSAAQHDGPPLSLENALSPSPSLSPLSSPSGHLHPHPQPQPQPSPVHVSSPKSRPSPTINTTISLGSVAQSLPSSPPPVPPLPVILQAIPSPLSKARSIPILNQSSKVVDNGGERVGEEMCWKMKGRRRGSYSSPDTVASFSSSSLLLSSATSASPA